MKTILKVIAIVFTLFSALLLNSATASGYMDTFYLVDPDHPAPLHTEKSETSALLGYCYNALPVIVLDESDPEWYRIRFRMTDQFTTQPEEALIEGYVRCTDIGPRNDFSGNPVVPKTVLVNTRNVEEGVPLNSITGQELYRVQNGQTLSVLLEQPDGLCYVSTWSIEEDWMRYGFVSKDELTPLDGSIALYPFDSSVVMNVFSYEFSGIVPKDMISAIDSSDYKDAFPLIGCIASYKARSAFIIMKEDGHYTLCYLEKNDGEWSLIGASDKCLYQDGVKPEKIYFLRYGDKVLVEFEEPEEGHFGFVVYTTENEDSGWEGWILSSAGYSAPSANFDMNATPEDNQLTVQVS